MGCERCLTHLYIEFLTSGRSFSSVYLYLYCCIITDLCVNYFFSMWIIIFLSKFPNDLEEKICSWDSRTEGVSGALALTWAFFPAAFVALDSLRFLFKEDLANPGLVDKQGINCLPGKPELKASLLMESLDLVCLLHNVVL